MKLYSTIKKEADAEIVIEKSRFIAHAKPVENREEAESFISDIKKKYRDATHNVPCFVLGEKMQSQWASDDGEPQGTSGAPMVQMLVQMGITNVCVVVTRYFGGIKLGTGGLVRAYTSALKVVLDESGICDVKEQAIIKIVLDYSYLNRVKCIESDEIHILSIDYGEKVTCSIATDPEMTENLKSRVGDITSGNIEIVSESLVTVKV